MFALDPTGKLVPWQYVEGILDDLTEDTWVAIALNGRIAGVGQALPFEGSANGVLSAIVAPTLARPGVNQLTLYAISGPPDAPVLRPIPVTDLPGQ